MLNLSNCMIKLDKSADYLRLVSLIYPSAMVVLCCSSWPFLLKFIGLILLLLQFLCIKTAALVSGSCSLLAYINGIWLLHDGYGRQKTYTKMRVVICTGLFFLVEFSHEKQRKMVVIFSDQISNNDCRLLKIIGKIN